MTTVETDNPLLKQQVREYWNSHPCGTQFTERPWGDKAFFEEVERFRYEQQPFMRSLMEFENFRGKKLLEIGCGLGTDLLQFARGGAIVTGVDLTQASIDLVKRCFEIYELPVETRVADAERLPFADGTFDAVYSFGVLHHTPDTPQSIREAYRVLKPGGRAIIMLYHRRSLHVWLGMVLQWMNARGSRTAEDWVRRYDGDDNPLGKAYSKQEIREMFRPFRNLRFTVVDSYRRRWPRWVNAINQRLFASHWGFWLVIKAAKPS